MADRIHFKEYSVKTKQCQRNCEVHHGKRQEKFNLARCRTVNPCHAMSDHNRMDSNCHNFKREKSYSKSSSSSYLEHFKYSFQFWLKLQIYN